jgi:hypothetical protein
MKPGSGISLAAFQTELRERCVAEIPERIDPGEVAARVRALVQYDEGGGLGPLARRLGVNEAALRDTLATDDPRLDVRTLAAVIHEFGIDPSWLLTGEYNTATHHLALDDDQQSSISAVLKLLTQRLTPPSLRAVQPDDVADRF